jgi:hypothetical protein
VATSDGRPVEKSAMNTTNQYNPETSMQYDKRQALADYTQQKLAAGGGMLSRARDVSPQGPAPGEPLSELTALAASLQASLVTLHELTYQLREQCNRVMGPLSESIGENVKESEPNCMVSHLHQTAYHISSALDDLRSCVNRIQRL